MTKLLSKHILTKHIHRTLGFLYKTVVFFHNVNRKVLNDAVLPLMSLALVSSLTLATLMMVRACWAYRSVLRLSSTLLPAGLSVAIIDVFKFPPRLSFNSLKKETLESNIFMKKCLWMLPLICFFKIYLISIKLLFLGGETKTKYSLH